jgi:hypothetical protein
MESLSSIRCNCNRLIAPLSQLYETLYNQEQSLNPGQRVNTQALLRKVESLSGGKLSDCCREKIFNPNQVRKAYEPQWDIITGVKSLRIGQNIATDTPGVYRRYVGDNTTARILPTRVFNLTGVLLKTRTPAEQARIDAEIKFGEFFNKRDMEVNMNVGGRYIPGDEKGLPVVEWDQRRMLMSEIMFISQYIRDRTKRIIFLGDLTGLHLQILKNLFKEIQFVEYDSSDSKVVSQIPVDLGTYSNASSGFICQYRTNDTAHDLKVQSEWYNKIKPLEALLRFTIPGYSRSYEAPVGNDITKKIFQYFDGRLFHQPWSSVFNSEVSLIPMMDKEKYYRIDDYQGAMTHHNFTVRPNLIKYRNPFLLSTGDNTPINKPELLNDYDSTDEIAILIGYFQHQKIPTVGNDIKQLQQKVLELSGMVTKSLGDSKVNLESLRNAAIATGPAPRKKKYYIGSQKSLGELFGKTMDEPGKTVVTASMLSLHEAPSLSQDVKLSPIPSFDAKTIEESVGVPVQLRIDYGKLCVPNNSSIINSLKPSQLQSFAQALKLFGIDEKIVSRVSVPMTDIGVDAIVLHNIFYNSIVTAVESRESEYQCLLNNVKQFKRITVSNSSSIAWFANASNLSSSDVLYLKPDITNESLGIKNYEGKIKIGDNEYNLLVVANRLAQTVKNVIVRIPINYDFAQYAKYPHVQLPSSDGRSDVLIFMKSK